MKTFKQILEETKEKQLSLDSEYEEAKKKKEEEKKKKEEEEKREKEQEEAAEDRAFDRSMYRRRR